jgi:hypothetical protein
MIGKPLFRQLPHPHPHSYTRTHTHVYIHTHIHMHTHTHALTYNCLFSYTNRSSRHLLMSYVLPAPLQKGMTQSYRLHYLPTYMTVDWYERKNAYSCHVTPGTATVAIAPPNLHTLTPLL